MVEVQLGQELLRKEKKDGLFCFYGTIFRFLVSPSTGASYSGPASAKEYIRGSLF